MKPSCSWWTQRSPNSVFYGDASRSLSGLHAEKYLLHLVMLNQTDIWLYSPFSDWFGTKWKSVWFQINRKMVNTIWFGFDLIRFGKHFSVWQGRGASLVILALFWRCFPRRIRGELLRWLFLGRIELFLGRI